jgi:hypothetical protein
MSGCSSGTRYRRWSVGQPETVRKSAALPTSAVMEAIRRSASAWFFRCSTVILAG